MNGALTKAQLNAIAKDVVREYRKMSKAEKQKAMSDYMRMKAEFSKAKVRFT